MRRLIPLLLLGLLAGCATTPPTAVHQPMSVRPQARQDSFAPNGSIFQAGSSRPLFEDRRARFMGDTLTINIVENTAASTKSNSKTERDGSVEASVTNMAGV
ncbi:MAG: hypothetical protein RIR00_2023, partial [Pseudomonadota bacterium]